MLRVMMCGVLLFLFTPRAGAQLTEATALLAFLNEVIRLNDALQDSVDGSPSATVDSACNATCLGHAAYRAGDIQEAVRQLRIGANEGDSAAQATLGLIYYSGSGVSKNPREAQQWLQLAAIQGDASAQWPLGMMYLNGEGVLQDFAEAERWFLLAADQGKVEAQFALGQLYTHKQGMEENSAEALRWLGLASDQGYAPALEAAERLCNDNTDEIGCPEIFIKKAIRLLDEDASSAVLTEIIDLLSPAARGNHIASQELTIFASAFMPDPALALYYLITFAIDCSNNNSTETDWNDTWSIISSVINSTCETRSFLVNEIEINYQNLQNSSVDGDLEATMALAIAYDIGLSSIKKDHDKALHLYLKSKSLSDSDEFTSMTVKNAVNRICTQTKMTHIACN